MANIAALLQRVAERTPDAAAIRVPHTHTTIRFRELDDTSDLLASGFSRLGIGAGQRVLVLVPFSAGFIRIAFALFKTGAAPVLIDPGLGRKNMLSCIEQAQPEAMVGVSLAHAVRRLFPKPFASVKTTVTLGRRWFWGGPTLAQVEASGSAEFQTADSRPEDAAAVLFTSGSTGPSKGVLYTHGMFGQQVAVLQSLYGIEAGETDLATFPLFSLFSIGMGMTTVIPEMDFTRPAEVDPQNILGAIQTFKVSNCFGSPALWQTVSRYGAERKFLLPSLRRVLIAGAPVPGSLIERVGSLMGNEGQVFTPYGATEALPVASIAGEEISGEIRSRSEQGAGTCVGQPVPGMQVKVIRILDDPIDKWRDDLEVAQGETGEFAVRGGWVTRHYCNRPEAEALAKVQDGAGFWHRMGDVGWRDEAGRLWFCGRKNQRVVTQNETLFTIPCEAVFNRHPDVRRSALVGVGVKGDQRPVLIVEPRDANRIRSAAKRRLFTQELRALGNEHTQSIESFLFHPKFPVDVRHNAKIFREKLALWAQEQLKGR